MTSQISIGSDVSYNLNNLVFAEYNKMYKVEILSDKLEQEAIARRRRLDEERKERIFNPKLRVLGVRIRTSVLVSD